MCMTDDCNQEIDRRAFLVGTSAAAVAASGQEAAGQPPAKAPEMLSGGVLAIGYFRAAGCAYRRHNSEDLERASIALKRLRLWAGVAVIVLIAFLACMAVAAVLTGEFPG
jgi:peptidoglycan/LPS O-acetylase OafA/YrhL